MADDTTIRQKIKDRLSNLGNQTEESQIISARQIISEIETINSRAAFALVQNRIQEKPSYRQLLNTLSRVAAILFIPLLIASIWILSRQLDSNSSQHYALQEITSPSGIRSQVLLPDGTKVWLNAESTLKFQVPFQGENRNVDLQGEAFFDVVKDQGKPFVVQTGKVKIKVLGTRFNCKSYAEDENVQVALEEGKIALNIAGSSGSSEKILHPGEFAVVGKSNLQATITSEEIDKYIAWHTGKLVFSNSPMSEVAQMLERWYGIDVVVRDQEIMNYRFTTTFENESLFQVIELLGLSSPIRIRYIQATLGKDNESKTRSQIIITKK